MITIAITGASGYIGKHLIAELARHGGCRIKVLSRSRRREIDAAGLACNIEVTEGDLRSPETLRGFFEPGCMVVNLVYLWNAGQAENLVVTENLLAACRTAKIGRLIHCSTAAVVGRVSDNLITEMTPCRPITEYGITKLRVEEVIVSAANGHFDCAILRPTSVFGPGGAPLKKLADDLVTGRRTRNYLKSCLFGKRRMNLVHVANVVSSILFLANFSGNLGGEVFIISDDDDPANNYAHVERLLMREFGTPDYSLPRIPVPPGILAFLLTCLGRNNVNPLCDYDPGKLIGYGFKRPISFESGLAEYTAWYKSSFTGR